MLQPARLLLPRALFAIHCSPLADPRTPRIHSRGVAPIRRTSSLLYHCQRFRTHILSWCFRIPFNAVVLAIELVSSRSIQPAAVTREWKQRVAICVTHCVVVVEDVLVSMRKRRARDPTRKLGLQAGAGGNDEARGSRTNRSGKKRDVAIKKLSEDEVRRE